MAYAVRVHLLWLWQSILWFRFTVWCGTVVPGSHKSNYRCPRTLKNGDRFSEYIKQVDANAGDVVIMTEVRCCTS